MYKIFHLYSFVSKEFWFGLVFFNVCLFSNTSVLEGNRESFAVNFLLAGNGHE